MDGTAWSPRDRTAAALLTPVPGGVGPLTVAMLMANTVGLAEKHQALEKSLAADEVS